MAMGLAKGNAEHSEPLNPNAMQKGPKVTSDLLKTTAERADCYLQSLKDRSVSPSLEMLAHLTSLGGSLPNEPTDPARVLQLLDEIGSPATVASAGGRYFGFVTGGSLPAALAANWLAGAWDQNAFSITSSPVAATLEEIALGWLLDLLNLPPGAGGAFVTGATMANFTALAAARHAVLERAGWDVEAEGLFGAPPMTVVVSAEAHPTLLKALALLGLGRQRVTTVATDGQGRMRADAIPPLNGPAIICLQAGNVNTGAFDPAEDICSIGRAVDAWVHVDGAFGMWTVVVPELSHLTRGIPEADSWATDAHKWLNVPYDSGLAFVKDPAALRAAMSFSAAYLPQGSQRESLNYTPEASRRARGVEVWAALRSLGRSGVGDLVSRNCRFARRFAERLEQAGCEILNDVVSNQVLVAFGGDEATRQVISAIQAEGTCWCGETIWQGRVAMRISVCSWATTEDDVEQSLSAMARIAAGVRDGRSG